MIIKNEDRGLIKKSILSSKAEDTLINRVFTKYNVASPKTEPEFISAISQAEIFKDDTNIKTIADNFYAFRNKFVHDYERLMESKTLIADLCFYAEKIVFDILKNRYTTSASNSTINWVKNLIVLIEFYKNNTFT